MFNKMMLAAALGVPTLLAQTGSISSQSLSFDFFGADRSADRVIMIDDIWRISSAQIGNQTTIFRAPSGTHTSPIIASVAMLEN